MRHLDIMIPQRWFISEAKARIDHPEDLVFDEGSAGAKKALAALMHAADTPHSVSIKWDGSPALIFGRDDDGFTLTDKSNFGSKTAKLPRTAADLGNMLFMRRPTDPGREAYAKSIAGLWNILSQAVPSGFRGYLQGDVLWTGTPPLRDGYYTFKPNKIRYSIPSKSPLGQLIKSSQAGIAVHSIFDDRSDDEPRAIDDINSLGLNSPAGLVLMGSEIGDIERTRLPKSITDKISSTITKASPAIDGFLDRANLSKHQITDLPKLMKSYVNSRAYGGKAGLADAPQGFMAWIDSDASGLTDRKRSNVLDWISKHKIGYSATWAMADQLTRLKDHVKKGVDAQVGTRIGTELRGVPGHEGYVVDSPHGKIKMVDRPHFMRKDD